METTLAPRAPTAPAVPTTPPPVHRGALIVLFGIVLPTITNLVELTTHMCAQAFFDPLPTLGHVFAVFMVPLASAFSLRALWRRDGELLTAAIFAQAVAMSIGGVYTLLFAPLTPLAVFAIPYMGQGILPLAPALSLLASLRALMAMRRLRIALGRPARRTVWLGLAAGVGLMVALQIPETVTRLLVATAASDDADTSRMGIRWLRRIGQHDLLLRACYQRPSGSTDIISAALNLTIPVAPEKMRDIYYRVTGRPFDSEPAPLLGRRGGSDITWDIDQGSSTVGVVAMRGLTLASSRIDGSIDGTAALAYLEWTFEFANAAPIEREARAEIVLPPGGVVSRVTLWIDGEEREAAVAARDVTRRAYERVVRRRRDPILVTTTAPDRVLVQCFPVPPGGGVMKARIGITAPLQLATRASGTLVLPYFSQKNFTVPASVGHAVWIASKLPLAAPAAPLVREHPNADSYEIRGRLSEPATPEPFAQLTVERGTAADGAWTPDAPAGARASAAVIIRQTLRAQRVPVPSRLVIVIDGSGAMAEAGEQVAAALAALPATLPVAVTIAGDDMNDLYGGFAPPLNRTAGLTAAAFAGGTDSLPALAAAWDLAAAEPGGAVLWIHGPQPVVLASPEALRQRIERRSDGPPIYTFTARGGENHLLAKLADLPGVQPVPRVGRVADDLTGFLRGLDGSGERIVAERERVTGAAATAVAGARTSDHLARLWARDPISELARGRSGALAGPAEKKQALELASRYRLVTAVSGAVVLESQQQFDEAGLEPGDGSHVPTVPEPGTWALLALLAVALLVARRRMGMTRAF